MQVNAETQLGFLIRDVRPLVAAVVAGYRYDPGDSDLDDAQPIYLSIPLGEYRRARRILPELNKENPNA